MSPNNPYHPDDENRDNGVPHTEAGSEHADPLAGNPYANQRRQAPPPDLDAGAPQLAAADVRRMNRRALAFLAGIVALLLFAAWFFLSSGNSAPPPKKPKAEETVTIPEAPKVAPVPEAAPKLPEPIALAPPPPLPSTLPQRTTTAAPVRTGPTLLERRMMDAQAAQAAAAAGEPMGMGGQGGPGGAFGMMPGMLGPSPQGGVPVNSAYGAKPLPDVSNASPLTHPDTLMLRGTFIRCVLETRIITDIPGFTSCIVTEPVYSFTGKRLLLPKGSKVLGKYEMEPNGPRVAVIWDRIVTPTGIDVNMASPGIDTLGGAGHPGYYNAHWGSRIGAALLISMLSDAFKYEAAEHGPRQTTISNGVVTQSPFESNTAATVQQLANQAVQRAANRPATVTINQGTVLAIYVAKDVDFSGVVARY
ncbi:MULTISPECIES: TrbI/VirB10 family protein [Luteibacter]|uniref:TrbI/VirB10 family protein n=1 Tax=Luteibacter flocculans TaxID=2780091 RepID=A0ABY4T3R6_9GAMM|nr:MULTISPECIES: TrbI/VirB10 family protein [Luteibacter]URL59534.1 TrbI/VirB10 family protein [Luteibacter flocculans]SFW62980.1 type IV secretion system protein VirB10 [Luteibacter sp. UNCMF366Tsu5.1]